METKVHGVNVRKNNVMRIAMIIIIGACSLTLHSKEIKDLPLAIEKASKGESSYQSNLIDYYYNTTKNYTEAVKWCNILIENQNARESEKEYANRILGYCAYEGTGVKKSNEDAIKYWKEGVKFKGASCALSLARLYAKELRDSIESINWYQTSAELGNKTAAYFLSQLYESGYVSKANDKRIIYPGVIKDISQSAKYYEIYIKNMGYNWSGVPTNSKLLYKLAQWHYKGEGNLKRDYSKAISYFNMAIESNENSREEFKLTTSEEGDALWCISVCYRFGRGVEKDELIARRYVKRAAEKGNEHAISLLSN